MIDREEEPLKSSVNDFEGLLEMSVWHDMKTTLEDRIELLRMVLEQSSDMEEILRAQGGIAELKMLIQLPEYLIKVLIDEQAANNLDQ